MKPEADYYSSEPDGAYNPHVNVNPEYLHANSTSVSDVQSYCRAQVSCAQHKSPFSAIAELIDNAVDAGASRCES